MSAVDTPPAEGQGLQRRLTALSDAAALLQRHGVDVAEAGIPTLVEHATSRLRHGSDRTVAALVGSTGSGKSSLLNAIAGEPVARAGVTRPTTSVTQAVTFGRPADELLDLLGVSRRHHVAGGDPALDGLVLLDLPDFDSVAVDHRLEVDRLVALVDLMVWVTDPQKYGDEVLHSGYLVPLATHRDVMQVVLNKADLLPGGALDACLADLGRLLAEDGLGELTPIATAATAPDGAVPLAGLLAAEVQSREAALGRIAADVDVATERLAAAHPALGSVDVERPAAQLVQHLCAAAGVDAVTALLERQHRRDATLRTGWPPLRILRRIRRAPLASLQPAAGSQVATAEVSRALRRFAEDLGEQVGDGWAGPVHATARSRQDDVVDAVDRRISRDVQDLRRPPRWWGLAGAAQTALLVVAAVGGLWLVGLAAAEAVLLVDARRFAPSVGTVPIPTALLLGGLGLGVVLALVAGLVARAGASRRARRARRRLGAQVGEVAEELVVDPVEVLLADARAVGGLLGVAGGHEAKP